MKEANGTLNISADIECPYCEHYFDLFDIEHLRDDGLIYGELFGGDQLGTKDFDSTVECPKCENELKIKEIEY